MEKRKFLIPYLKTANEKPRTPGLLENLIAMIKRNMNTPDLAGTIDIDVTSRSVVDGFLATFLREERLEDHLQTVRSLSSESFNDWYCGQTQLSLGQLANYDFIDLPPIDTYMHMIKRQPKAKLDKSIQSEYPALQTIVYHPKVINAIFGPVFKFLTESFLNSVDNSKFFFYTRKTPEELEKFFSDLSAKSEWRWWN